jgi:hypothetical protein
MMQKSTTYFHYDFSCKKVLLSLRFATVFIKKKSNRPIVLAKCGFCSILDFFFGHFCVKLVF